MAFSYSRPGVGNMPGKPGVFLMPESKDALKILTGPRELKRTRSILGGALVNSQFEHKKKKDSGG